MHHRVGIAFILLICIAGCNEPTTPNPLPSAIPVPTAAPVPFPSPTAMVTSIPFETAINSSIGGAYGITGQYASSTTPELFPISDSKQLNQVWKATVDVAHGEQIPPQNPLSRVDFNDSMVLAFFLGPRPNSGYRIEIRKLSKSTSVVEMVVETAVPTPPLAAVLSSPCVFITIKRSDWPAQGRIIVKDVNGTTYVDKTVGQ
ncbi:MAG: protease complex subunit PrcB family protein [Chloroflexi bacterium]|nr:protease complex subunit PrcB family protein [Chloroflexota bacterium]